MRDTINRFLRWLFTPPTDWRDTDEYDPDLAVYGDVVPTKQKRKNDDHDEYFRPASVHAPEFNRHGLWVFRSYATPQYRQYPDYFSTIVNTSHLNLRVRPGEDADIRAQVYRGDALVVGLINRAGLYEEPSYDPDWAAVYMVEGWNVKPPLLYVNLNFCSELVNRDGFIPWKSGGETE